MLKETESNLNSVADTEPGYGQLFSVLIRRRFWLLGVLCSVLSVATIFTLITKPTYESSMRLLVEPNYQGKKDTTEAPPENQFADSKVEVDYATQINVMRSSLLLQKAVDLLRPEYSDIDVDKVKSSLVLTQVLEDTVSTKIVEAVYTDDDPVKTQKVLEAVYRIYQYYNREQQEQRLKKGLRFIDEQIPVVRELVDQSDAKLEKFRKLQNLIGPDQQATAITESLNTTEQERQKVRADLQESQARYTQLQQQIARSPQNALTSSRLSQSSRYQSLLNELQKTEQAIAQRRTVFKESDPGTQRLLVQRQSQLALLKAEIGRVLGKPAQNTIRGNLLAQGQLGEVDLNLTEQLLKVQADTSALKARDASLAQTEQQLRADLNRFPALLAEYNRLQPLVEINRNQLEQLLKARQELSLEIARRGFDWQALEEPAIGIKIGPNFKQNLLLGLVVGLLLGSVAAFLREMVDDAVHNSDQLEKQFALPLLGINPELPHTKASEPSINLPFGKASILTPWTVEVSKWSPSWESLDLIYQNIQLLNSLPLLRSLMVTSVLDDQDSSRLAFGLAVSAARLHQRVLLIDTDLRRPHLDKLLNLSNEHGLSTLLTSDASVPSKTDIHSSGLYIDVLTTGPAPPDPANLLSSQRMRELMAAFEQTYDLILLVAPPVLGMVDAVLTASFCSGVVLLTRIGQVTRTEITQAAAMLSKLNLIGVVAVNGTGSANKEYLLKTRRLD